MKHRILFTLLLLIPATQLCMPSATSPRSRKKPSIAISIASSDDKHNKEEEESSGLKKMLDQDTQKTKQALRDINALAAKTAQARKEQERTYADMAAGIGSAVWGVWLYHANPAAVVRSAHMRFITGAEIPIAMGILKTILAPTVVLLLGGYAYYKIKQAIAEPYKQENEKMVADFKKMLVDHKTELHDMYRQREQKMNADVIGLRTNIVTIQGMVDKVLKDDREYNNQEREKNLREFEAKIQALLKELEGTKGEIRAVQSAVEKLNNSRENMDTKLKRVEELFKDVEQTMRKLTTSDDRLIKNIQAILEKIEAMKKELAQKKDKKEKKSIFG